VKILQKVLGGYFLTHTVYSGLVICTLQYSVFLLFLNSQMAGGGAGIICVGNLAWKS